MRAQVNDGWKLPLPARDALPGAAGDMDDDTWERLQRFATPHPFASYTQPVTYSGNERRHRRVGIGCRDAWQILALARSEPGNPMLTDLLAADWTWLELEAGHWPMLTAPQQLAALLAKV